MYVVFLYDLSWSAFVVYFIVRMSETDQFGIERRFNSAVNVPSGLFSVALRLCFRIFDVYGLI